MHISNKHVNKLSPVHKVLKQGTDVNTRGLVKGGKGGRSPPQSFDNPFLKMLKSG